MVRSAFKQLGVELGSPDGRCRLSAMFGLCSETTGQPEEGLEDVEYQRFFSEQLWELVPVQANDPANAPNIQTACEALLSSTSRTTALEALASLSNDTSATKVASQCRSLREDVEDMKRSLTDTSLERGVNRLWFWQTCTEFGFYQTCEPGSGCPFTTAPFLSTLDVRPAINALPSRVCAPSSDSLTGHMFRNRRRLICVRSPSAFLVLPSKRVLCGQTR